MTDAVTLTATAPAVPQPITAGQAAQMLAEQRAAQAKPDLSAHASALGKAAAEARKARTAEAQAQPEAEAGEPEQDDETQGQAEGETLNENTASDGTSEDQTQEQADSQDDGTIDLGDGVKIEKELAREGIMLKADYTRKTQALAEERKQLETIRTQKVAQLDTALTAVQNLLPQPKDQDVLIDELGLEEGIKAFAQQQRMWASFGKALEARQAEQSQYVEHQKQTTIKHLSEKHGDKAANIFSEAVQYVSSKTGTDARSVEALLAHPEAVEMVKDAIAYRELKAKEPDVKRTLAEKPKVVKPGAKVSAQATAQSNVQNARANLKKSGSLADAVAFLQAQRKARG